MKKRDNFPEIVEKNLIAENFHQESAKNPYYPFQTEYDQNMALWIMLSGSSESAANDLIAINKDRLCSFQNFQQLKELLKKVPHTVFLFFFSFFLFPFSFFLSPISHKLRNGKKTKLNFLGKRARKKKNSFSSNRLGLSLRSCFLIQDTYPTWRFASRKRKMEESGRLEKLVAGCSCSIFRSLDALDFVLALNPIYEFLIQF